MKILRMYAAYQNLLSDNQAYKTNQREKVFNFWHFSLNDFNTIIASKLKVLNNVPPASYSLHYLIFLLYTNLLTAEINF